MPTSALDEALRAFAGELAALLAAELDAGAELPFDVLEEAGGPPRRGRSPRPVLYRYRPLTEAFIAERWPEARALESYAPATKALVPRAGSYLRQRGRFGADPDEALRDIVERLFDDVASFELIEDRLAAMLAELATRLEAETVPAAVIAPVHGLRIASPRVELRPDLALVRRSAIGSPPAAVEGAARAPEAMAEADEAPTAIEPSPLDVFCRFESDLGAEASLPVDEARALFRRLLTALRLSGAGGTAIGPLAWARVGDGPWRPAALGVSARSRPESWELLAADEAELRELLELLARSRHGPTVAWALDRFEMGCERELQTEALTDYLLGLRALLDDPEPSGRMAVARRLAALCAAEPERDAMRGRLELALDLERGVIHGEAEHGAALALDSPGALVADIERQLRALLRDVLCGYLEEDLRTAADALLVATAAATAGTEEFRVRDLRGEGTRTEPKPAGDRPGATAVTPSIDWAPTD